MDKELRLKETEMYLKLWKYEKDENALLQLINKNSGLITYFAKKHVRDGIPFEDLFSAGKEGLFKAIENFDYNKYGIQSFSTYISYYIEGYIKREKQKFLKNNHVLSFEQPIGSNKDGDEMKLEDLVGTDAEELIENVISEMEIDIVKDAIKCLNSKEQQIILLRYGLDDAHKKTQEEIAQMFSCSQAQVARMEQKALIKMRHPRNTRKLKDFIDE